jgi:hypothetical protein
MLLFVKKKKREKVRTTNFTTSKTKKNIEKVGDDHYIEKIYKSDQNVEKGKDQNIEMCPLVQGFSTFWDSRTPKSKLYPSAYPHPLRVHPNKRFYPNKLHLGDVF